MNLSVEQNIRQSDTKNAIDGGLGLIFDASVDTVRVTAPVIEAGGDGYGWIERPIRADKKSILKRTRGAMINPRPRMKSSWRGESRFAGYFFLR